MKTDANELILSSGRPIDAHNLIVGIDPALCVYGGYDTTISEADADPDPDIAQHGQPFTKAEKLELAAYMIGLWQAYKEKAER
jgi:hypothetical protein